MRLAPRLSLVIPLFREEGVLPELMRRTRAALVASGVAYEIVFVDDGSDAVDTPPSAPLPVSASKT